MSEEKEFFKICFNTVAGLEVKNESQAIAKEVVLSEVEQLQQENQQLKIQISAREEECRKLDETNKVLSQELTKDKILKQDHLTTCCGIPIGNIPKLVEKNKKLENNWNKLKVWLDNEINQQKHTTHWCVQRKMQELERGVSDVG